MVVSRSEIVRVWRCVIGLRWRNVGGVYNSLGPPARRVRECRFGGPDRSLARSGILSFSAFPTVPRAECKLNLGMVP